MKKISTLAVLIGSGNTSLLFTIYYNYDNFPPICYLILSTCFLFLLLLAEYEYRRFKMLDSDSVLQTIRIFNKYLYLFAVGVVLVTVKLTMYFNQTTFSLNHERYVFVGCFDPENNLYLNMLYYLGNYASGTYYIHLFRSMHNKFINRELQGADSVISRREIRCTVCLADIPTGGKAAVTKCGHSFHQKCLRKWLEVKNVCPLCKQIVITDLSVVDTV